jgi:hypothetical protein
MLGVCFGHQIMADALGGDVRKSEKGWGLGRHVYAVGNRPAFVGGALPEFAVACSHQDQVMPPRGRSVPPEFTPTPASSIATARRWSPPHEEITSRSPSCGAADADENIETVPRWRANPTARDGEYRAFLKGALVRGGGGNALDWGFN